MKKTVFALAASAALLASAFSAHATEVIKITGASVAPVIAGQLSTGLVVGEVKGGLEITNQGVGVNIESVSAQKTDKVVIDAINGGLTVAIQVTGPVLATTVGGGLKISNVAVGANVTSQLKN